MSIETKYGACDWAKMEDGGVLRCRVKIEGEYKGEKWTHEDGEDWREWSQFINDGDPSAYWWEDGNMSCDCNRYGFLPEHLRPLVDPDGHGHEIIINKIIPFDSCLPTLELDNSWHVQ